MTEMNLIEILNQWEREKEMDCKFCGEKQAMEESCEECNEMMFEIYMEEERRNQMEWEALFEIYEDDDPFPYNRPTSEKWILCQDGAYRSYIQREHHWEWTNKTYCD